MGGGRDRASCGPSQNPNALAWSRASSSAGRILRNSMISGDMTAKEKSRTEAHMNKLERRSQLTGKHGSKCGSSSSSSSPLPPPLFCAHALPVDALVCCELTCLPLFSTLFSLRLFYRSARSARFAAPRTSSVLVSYRSHNTCTDLYMYRHRRHGIVGLGEMDGGIVTTADKKNPRRTRKVHT